MKAAASPVKEPKVPRIFVIERYKRTFGHYSSPQHSDKSSKGGKGKTCDKNLRNKNKRRGRSGRYSSLPHTKFRFQVA